MNKLELLPKSIDYNGRTFFLQVHVTAWGHLCIRYKEFGGDRKILSYVVEKNKPEYIPDIIEETETSGLNEEIGNCPTLDACLTSMIYKINELAQKEVLKAEYHD
jgi:hypothetical protein